MKEKNIKMPAFKKEKSKVTEKKNVVIKLAVTVTAIVLSVAVLSVAIRDAQIKEYKTKIYTLPRDFTITAHTGCMGTPENSKNSMNAGVANGADIIEFDVNFTDDGTPVLSHDAPTGGELTLAEAFEYLAAHPRLKANVDMKSVENIAEVQRLAIEHGVITRIFLTGITSDTVTTVHNEAPKLKYYLNIDVEKSKNTDAQYLSELVLQVQNCEALGINMNYKNASAELVNAFQLKNLKVSLWTVDDELDMYKMLSLTPNNITTRNPDELSKITG